MSSRYLLAIHKGIHRAHLSIKLTVREVFCVECLRTTPAGGVQNQSIPKGNFVSRFNLYRLEH